MNSTFAKFFKIKTIILVALTMFIIWTSLRLFVSIPGYSEGSRSIVLEKFSKKGIFFKTWEGTGVLPGYDNDPENGGMVRKTWEFSVTNPLLAKEIESFQGGKITLTYEENYLTSFKDGDSRYIVTGIFKK